MRKAGNQVLIASTAGTYALIAGVLTLLGYALDVRRLTDWDNDGISPFNPFRQSERLSPPLSLHLVMLGLSMTPENNRAGFFSVV